MKEFVEFKTVIDEMDKLFQNKTPNIKPCNMSKQALQGLLPHNLERRNLEFPQPRDPQPRGSVT